MLGEKRRGALSGGPRVIRGLAGTLRSKAMRPGEQAPKSDCVHIPNGARQSHTPCTQTHLQRKPALKDFHFSSAKQCTILF